MKTLSTNKVLEMYESTAASYAKMMDEEINLPIYEDTLSRLQKRLVGISGPLIDTACGSGHMLIKYNERFDKHRALLGVDLSPNMVSIARNKLGSKGQIIVGDMRDLSTIKSNSSAALMNFFAIHHLDQEGIQSAFNEWQLLLAAWEGSGKIDYGDASEIVALRYRADELSTWIMKAGFKILRCVVEPIEGFTMDAVYLEGAKK